MNKQGHHASKILMVVPSDFAFNTQTGKDNEFQHPSQLDSTQILALAMAESQAMAHALRANGVNVVMFDPAEFANHSELTDPSGIPVATPDAVFPNNWFSTTGEGELVVYPMATANRQAEVKIEGLKAVLGQSGSHTNRITDVRSLSRKGEYLEGTGVVVFDHNNHSAYAALSERCHQRLLQQFCQHNRLTLHEFSTCLPSGSPVYHTNVMMSVGESFAVICSEVIAAQHRRGIMTQLRAKKQVIDISQGQLQQFCGNILQIKNSQGEKLIAMSTCAFNGFTLEQRELLAQHGRLLVFDIPTIESIGGGSVRCMMAEIFY